MKTEYVFVEANFPILQKLFSLLLFYLVESSSENDAAEFYSALNKLFTKIKTLSPESETIITNIAKSAIKTIAHKYKFPVQKVTAFVNTGLLIIDSYSKLGVKK